VFTFDDEYSFGILQSRYHCAWFWGTGSNQGKGKGKVYSPPNTWETFPWPQAPTAAQVRAVTTAASELLTWRDAQIRSGTTADALYDTLKEPGKNALRDLHGRLDDSVRDAYGFDPAGHPAEQLLELNGQLAEAAARGDGVRGPGPDGFGKTRMTDFMIESELVLPAVIAG
jgi:hypothetical protein